MLSLLNKSSGEKASVQVVPWRPDFRDLSLLPDTKTVRTNFFVNLVGASLAGALLLYVAFREWRVVSMNSMIADVESRIQDAEPGAKKAVEAYRLFQAEEAKFNEAYALVKDPFRFHTFLIHLGETLPENVAIRRAELRGATQTVFVAGWVKGTDAAATDVASAYVKQLQEDKTLATHFASVTLTNIGRSVDEGSLAFELQFSFKKPEVKAPAKK